MGGRSTNWRARLRAFGRLLPGARSFLFLTAALVLVLIVAIALMALRYEYPGTHDGLDFPEAVWAVFGLLFFATNYPWPDMLLIRLLYFLVPLLGLSVLAQLIARLASLLFNRDRWESAMASTFQDHIIVCGLGKVGQGVVRWLLDLNETVVVIESDGGHASVEHVRGWGVPVIIGDARRSEILEQAGLSRASALLPVTNDELVNLVIASEARCLKHDIKVILRTFEERVASSLTNAFDINAAYSTATLAAPAFAAAATHVPVDYAFVFDGAERELLTITRFTVARNSPLMGKTVQDLETEFDIAVVAHHSARPSAEDRGRTHPLPDTVLNEGDYFVVSASLKGLARLAHLTPPTRELERQERAAAGASSNHR